MNKIFKSLFTQKAIKEVDKSDRIYCFDRNGECIHIFKHKYGTIDYSRLPNVCTLNVKIYGRKMKIINL